MNMLEKHMVDLHDAILDCHRQERWMPCLVLLYSGIDIVASLEPSTGGGVRERFENWVDKYLLAGRSFACTATDLYGARCAVVHTFTPDSDLSSRGKARVVGYAFGPAEVRDLDDATAMAGHSQIQVNIHVRDLIHAFFNGFADYWAEVQADFKRRQEVERSAGMWSVVVGTDLIKEYLNAKGSS
jgi:hypothetical protein